jgi:hypothetical protein
MRIMRFSKERALLSLCAEAASHCLCVKARSVKLFRCSLLTIRSALCSLLTIANSTKGHSMTCLCRRRWDVEVQITPVRNPALEGDGWSAPRSGHFTTGETHYPWCRMLAWPVSVCRNLVQSKQSLFASRKCSGRNMKPIQRANSCNWFCIQYVVHEIRKRKANWIGHILCRNCLLKQVIEGKIKEEMEVTRRRGRRSKKLLDDLNDKRGYSHLKEEALDRTVWRNRLDVS